MKGFSNPLVFDEKEMRRSNILNEMLHGQYEDVFRRCFETRQLRPVCVDFSRVWLCLTGMKRSSYTQLGRMPYEQLELNQRYAEAILPQLDAMGMDTELFMNVYSREKLLVFLMTPRDEAADVAQAAQAINDALQAMYERELPGGGSPYFNFTVLSRRLSSFDEIAPAFESLSRLHALSFFEMRSASRTQEELERRAQRLDERALSEHIQTIKTALLSGDEQSRKGAQVLLYEQLRDGADPETVRAVMRELRQMLGRIIRVFALPDDPAIEQTLDMARYSGIRALCDACFELLDVYDRRIRRRDLPMGQITFKALEYIANHYQENLSQKDVADYIGITPQYLSGLFNREIGRSIPDVINEKRVERAKELLRTTALSSAEIARRVGFGNTTYFYTVFRKLAGVTVREYREQAGTLPE